MFTHKIKHPINNKIVFLKKPKHKFIKIYQHFCLYITIPLLWSLELCAYETDQYSTLFYELEDSTIIMDKLVNDAIEHVVLNWNSTRNEYKLLSRVAGFFHSRQLEKWINDSTLIETRNIKSDSVFKTTGWESSPIIRWKGLAATLNLNHIYIGTDKLSHFFGVGWMYWKKSEVENKDQPEEVRRNAAIQEGLHTENTYWGRLSTNIFSNADLVSNWEGYLFFRGMFEDNIVHGKKAIIRWNGDQPVIQRKFSFKDHVNDFWSEALLPNDYDSILAVKVKNVLRTYCENTTYLQQPERWLSKQHDILWKKYIQLDLEPDAMEFRLDQVCQEFATWPERDRNLFLKKQKTAESSYNENMTSDDHRMLNVTPITGNIINRIASPVPTCNTDIESAINEHRMVSAFLKDYGSIARKKLDEAVAITSKKGSKKFDLKSHESLSKKYFKTVFAKISPKKIKSKLWDNVYISRLTKSINIEGEKIKLIAEYTNYGTDLVKECLIMPIPLLQSTLSVRKGFMKISIYQCIYTSKEKGVFKSTIFWRAYDTDKKLRSSLKNYNEIDDREGYIYRMIPKICKWY